MTDGSRVVTANLPADLVSELDEVASRIDRTRSWVVREALRDWLQEEQRRHVLTLEALADLDAGRTLTQEQVEEHLAKRKAARRHKV